MAGRVIGTSFDHGFAGHVSRSVDNIVLNSVNGDTKAIEFGAPVVLATNGVKNFVGGSSTAAQFVGIAVRIAKTNETYGKDDAAYQVGENIDVLTRGTVSVVCVAGTPAEGGAVYIDGNGDFTANAASATLIANAKWRGGADANKVAELTVLTRNL